MREMKHSKKLAFAVLAAVTAVGANVNPVDAASVVMDNTNVVTGANNAVAYGSGNTVKESDANFRDRDYENEPDDATKRTGDWKSNSVAIGVNNTAAGTSALAMGNSSKALMNESIAIGHSAEAQRTWSTAIGTRAKASEVRSQAIGYEALASGYKSNLMRLVLAHKQLIIILLLWVPLPLHLVIMLKHLALVHRQLMCVLMHLVLMRVLQLTTLWRSVIMQMQHI